MAERQGRVENVWSSPAGSRLTTAHVISDTVLNVGSSTDFSGFGGYVKINGTTYQYLSKDSVEIGGLAEGYADTLTLSSGLLAAAAVDDDVLVDPPAEQMWAMVLFNDDAPSDQSVIARVPHSLAGWFPNQGIRGFVERESVTLDLIGNEWVIQDVYGKIPGLDGSVIEPGTTPGDNISDGIPPATSPTPTVIGGVGVLHVRWTGILNADNVTYEVHVSTTDNFTPTSSTLYEETSATTSTIKSLPPAGDALTYGPEGNPTVYYVRIYAKDIDGYATGGWSPDITGTLHFIANEEISAAYLYAGQIIADQIISGDLSATLAVLGEITTASVGRRLSLTSEHGLRALGSADELVAHIPTDLAQNISFKADVVANSLTALGDVAMRSAGNEIAQSAVLAMRAGVTAPVTPPTATIVWTSISRPTQTPNASKYRSAYYYATNNEVLQARYDGGGVSYVEIFNATTGASTGSLMVSNPVTTGPMEIYSCFRSGAIIYVLVILSGGQPSIRRYDTGTSTWLTAWNLGSASTFDEGMGAITVNTAGQLVLLYRNSSAVVRNLYNRDTGALAESVTITSMGTPSSSGISGLYEGPSDIGGADRTWYTTYADTNVYCFEGNVAGDPRATTVEFPTASGQAVAGLWYDTTRGYFVTNNKSNATWNVYDGTKWTTESSTWYVNCTWYDGDATGGTHETTMGVATSFTMKKRARLTLSSPAIPDNGGTDDPDRVRFYIGRGSLVRTTQWLNGSPAAGVTQVANIQTVSFSGTNPPATNNFPGSTPGIITADDSQFYFRGDGDASFRTLDADTLVATEYKGSNARSFVNVGDNTTQTLAAGASNVAVGAGLSRTLTVPTGGATYIIQIIIDAQSDSTSNNSMTGSVRIDGVNVGTPAVFRGPTGNIRLTFSTLTRQSLSAGSHTIEVVLSNSASTTYTIRTGNCVLMIWRAD